MTDDENEKKERAKLVADVSKLSAAEGKKRLEAERFEKLKEEKYDAKWFNFMRYVRYFGTSTRNERRNLIAVSFVGFVMFKFGIEPKGVPALGIDFEGSSALYWVVLVATGYYFIYFLLYVQDEFMRGKAERADEEVEWQLYLASPSELQSSACAKHWHEKFNAIASRKKWAWVRTFAEVWMPCAFAVLSFVLTGITLCNREEPTPDVAELIRVELVGTVVVDGNLQSESLETRKVGGHNQ